MYMCGCRTWSAHPERRTSVWTGLGEYLDVIGERDRNVEVIS